MSDKPLGADAAAVESAGSIERDQLSHVEDFDCPSCGFAYYGPPALCTCGKCDTSDPDELIDVMRTALSHAENEMLRLRATASQLAPIRAALAKAEGRK